jgi:hypothetical protein
MTRLNGIAACFGALALTAFLATPARADLEVKIIDSLGSTVICATTVGSCTGLGTPGSINTSFTDGDFSLILQTATSNSPGGTVAKLYNNTEATATAAGDISSCSACGTGFNLEILVSDTGFTMPIGLTVLTQNVNTNDSSTSPATGKANFSGYETNGTTIFAMGGTEVGPASFSSFDNSNNATQSVGVTTSNPFVLTEELQLDLTNTQQGQATANLTVSSVPEPASILLFGTVLLGLGSLLRKRVAPKS